MEPSTTTPELPTPTMTLPPITTTLDPLALIILSSTLLSTLATFYSFTALVRSRKKGGVKAVVMSFGAQILLWDLMRCLTIGLVSGLYHMRTPLLENVCSIIGPLADISHRLPFFLCLGHVLASSKKTHSSGTWRRSGVVTVVMGYLVSLTFSLLPFTQGNTYILGYEGFCTYYSDMVLPAGLVQTWSEQDYLKWNILLSVVPFMLMFGVLGVGVMVAAVGYKTDDITSYFHSSSLLLAYLPMCGVGVTLVAAYCGVNTLLFSYEEHIYQLMLWVRMFCLVIFPVLKPLFSSILLAAVSICRSEAGPDSDKINKEYSLSTAILVRNVDGFPE